MFIAMLFTIVKRQKPSNVYQLKKRGEMWDIYTTEYYSAKKKKEVLISVTTWMNLENILLSERSQSQKIT